MQVYYKRINLERRLGNPEGAAALYEYYIANHTNKVISNNMAIKYARYNAKVNEIQSQIIFAFKFIIIITNI